MISPLQDETIGPAESSASPALAPGVVLLARENLDDPNFIAGVVLLCIYNADGAFGLIINRPSHMPLNEVFELDSHQAGLKRTIFIGGPVQQESLQIIQVTDTPAKNSYRVAPRVFLGGEWTSLEDILSSDSRTTRLFLGYSGWGQGQLEAETAAGAWEVLSVDTEKLLMGPQEKLFGDFANVRNFLMSVRCATTPQT
jgi:putative transcriptional regulator